MEFNGAVVDVTADPSSILSAQRLVLPGVGAFAKAMDSMVCLGLVEPVIEVARRGVPVLGICLGMQLLMTRSHEHGLTDGLNLIAGEVIPLPKVNREGGAIRVPHIGWEELRCEVASPILGGVDEGEAVYFVHSFMASPENAAEVIASVEYEGIMIPAIIGRENVYGCQFHPEKSGETGLAIIRNFMSI